MDGSLNPDPPGTLILEGIVGSTAYGLAHAGSDLDRLGIFVAPTAAVLGLDGRKVVDHTQVTKNPDSARHELGKFLGLALQCNPTVMELLWLADWETNTPAGQQVIGLRHAVLSARRTSDAFGGYAIQQARRLVRRTADGKAGFAADLGPRTAKHGRHCARLLLSGRMLLETGELVVDVSPWRDHLFGMGELAETDPEGFLAAFESEVALLNQAAARSALPERPDRERVNEVLVAIRRSFP
jgi:hypothetical protein